MLRRTDFWLALAGTVALGLLLWYYSEPVIHLMARASDSRAWIESYGGWAPAAYISLYVTQIVIAPFPGNFMGILAGWLFGIFWGALYSVVALTIGISIAIGLSRLFGRPLLERFVAEDTLNKWEVKLKVRSPLLWTIIFMFPVPDALIYMAGLSSIPFRILVPAIVIGRSAGIIFANIMGGWSAKLPPEWVIVQWSILIITVALLYWYQRYIKLYVLLGYRRLRRMDILSSPGSVQSNAPNAWARRADRAGLSTADIDES